MLLDADIAFGPASGREPEDLAEYFRYDRSCYATGVFANGKIVRIEGKTVFEKPVEKAPIESLLQLVEPLHDCFLLFYVHDKQGDLTFGVLGGTEQDISDVMAETPIKSTPVILEDIPTEPCYTVDVIYGNELGDKQTATRHLRSAVPQFDYVAPAPHLFDVLPHGWSKADATEILLDRMGIRSEEVAFFGDSDNDLTMLRRMPNSFAVANGSPAALGCARWQIGDASADAPAQVMEKIALAHGGLPVEFNR
jgi:hydroxymethylpyrimidine pyrophosphatase-like HAD family hydrolase